MDDCYVCDGDNSCVDCSGVVFGTAYLGYCGACVGGNTGLEWNHLLDDCWVCGGDNSCIDCSGVVHGWAYLDECGACVGGNTGLDACEP